MRIISFILQVFCLYSASILSLTSNTRFFFLAMFFISLFSG